MLSINYFASPSSGKSTSAAYSFAFLKNRGCNVELVTEYAKSMVYSRRLPEMSNQIYLLAKQYKKMKDIEEYGHVPMVITDSPILLGMVYSQGSSYFPELVCLANKLHREFENVNVFVRRVKPYNPSGRNQTAEQSDALIPMVRDIGIDFDYEIDGDEAGQKTFAQLLFDKYGERLEISPSRRTCTLPPVGWRCTRTPGHTGPCATGPEINS